MPRKPTDITLDEHRRIHAEMAVHYGERRNCPEFYTPNAVVFDYDLHDSPRCLFLIEGTHDIVPWSGVAGLPGIARHTSPFGV